MTDQVNQPPEKKRDHLWKKGQSGNPKGRPVGSRNQISIVKMQVESELRAQMQGDMKDVLGKILEMAKAGDPEMLKLLYKSWVSGTKVQDEEAPKDKIVIQIGKLDQVPSVKGRVIASDSIDSTTNE